MLSDLASLFPDAKAFASIERARAKLARAVDGVTFERSTSAIVQRVDGLWLPVVILGPRDTWLARGLAERGVCVTN